MTVSVHVNLLRATTKKAGAELPPGLVDEFDRLTVTKAPQYDPGVLVAAVTSAVLAGRDPAEDKAVRDALIRHQIASIDVPRLVAEAVDDKHADALRDHATEFLDALAAVVTAAQQAVDTYRTGDGLDLSDNAATRLSADTLPAWATARAALARADHAATAWHQLAVLVRGVPEVADPRYRALVLADLSSGDLDHALATQRTNARALVEDGHRLELADWDTWADRLKRIRTDRNEAERAVADERHQGVRRVYGLG